MTKDIQQKFLNIWEKYFPGAELPITCYYSENTGGAEAARVPKGWNCFIGELSKVRKGSDLYFNREMLTCGGSSRYLGYTQTMRPNFEYFLSCGIPGKMEGERYIKTPEMVKNFMSEQKEIPAQEKNLVVKRWDHLTEADNPEIVIFFATPDMLAGLFTLANFDRASDDSTIVPFGAGCGSIINYPYFEMLSDKPRAVIGMFDPSARPFVEPDILTFAVPFKRLQEMMDNAEESFLITKTWTTVANRIEKYTTR